MLNGIDETLEMLRGVNIVMAQHLSRRALVMNGLPIIGNHKIGMEDNGMLIENGKKVGKLMMLGKPRLGTAIGSRNRGSLMNPGVVGNRKPLQIGKEIVGGGARYIFKQIVIFISVVSRDVHNEPCNR